MQRNQLVILVAALAAVASSAVQAAPASATPPAVDVVRVTRVSVSLTWAAVPGAHSYRVGWDDEATLVGSPGYTDLTIPCGTERTYGVTPLDAAGQPLDALTPAAAESVPCPPPPDLHGHHVFMFYYPWYLNDTHDGSWAGWRILPSYNPDADNIASDFWPLGGPYSIADPRTLDRQFAEIRQAGADVLVESWDGPGSAEDLATPLILERAAAAGLHVAFQLEPYDGRSPAALASDIAYLNQNYGTSPAFFRTTRPGLHTAGRPAGQGAFFLYAPGESMWPRYCSGCDTQVSASAWAPAVDAVHASAAGGIVIGTGSYGPADLRSAHLDGAYLYAVLPTTGNNPYQVARRWEVTMPPTAWYVPSVTPGFANDCAQASTSIHVLRNAGATYSAQWNAIWSGPALHDIAVTSFNEWHEGTQIEPAAYGHPSTGTSAVCASTTADRYRDYSTVGAYGYLYRTNAWVQRFAAAPIPGVYALRRAVGDQLGAVNHDQGLSQLDSADGLSVASSEIGRPARAALGPSTRPRYLYLAVDNHFAWRLPPGRTMRVAVTLLDHGGGSVRVDYDSRGGAFTGTSSVRLTGSGNWRTLTFTLPNVYFGDREDSGADLRIVTPAGRATWVSAVSVSRG